MEGRRENPVIAELRRGLVGELVDKLRGRKEPIVIRPRDLENEGVELPSDVRALLEEIHNAYRLSLRQGRGGTGEYIEMNLSVRDQIRALREAANTLGLLKDKID